MLCDVLPIRAEEAFNKALQCDTIELSISRSHSFLLANRSGHLVNSVNETVPHNEIIVDARISEEGKNNSFLRTTKIPELLVD